MEGGESEKRTWPTRRPRCFLSSQLGVGEEKKGSEGEWEGKSVGGKRNILFSFHRNLWKKKEAPEGHSTYLGRSFRNFAKTASKPFSVCVHWQVYLWPGLSHRQGRREDESNRGREEGRNGATKRQKRWSDGSARTTKSKTLARCLFSPKNRRMLGFQTD